jgi:CCR4-NOT transcription complex subunit 2
LPLLKMSDADLTMLSLGTDLTSLGLNLNAPDNLHKALASLLADVPVRGED